jgi:hypothetical protein
MNRARQYNWPRHVHGPSNSRSVGEATNDVMFAGSEMMMICVRW